MPHSRTTPAIPREFRDFRDHPHYTSIFEIYPNEMRLFGTEDWHGDWNARVLFMAKDAGSSRIFRPTSEGGRGWRWVTDHARPTNRNLAPLLDQIPGGKLYASFLGPLLRNDERESGELPMTDAIEMFVDSLLSWTVANMPALEVVAVLGKEAWLSVTRACGKPESGSQWKDRHRCGNPLLCDVQGRSLHLVALNHPARIPSATLQQQPGWLWILSRLTHGSASLVGASKTVHPRSTSPRAEWSPLPPLKIRLARPVGIRGGLLEILKAAGSNGVNSDRFSALNWRDEFRPDKLRKAMGYLAGETGLSIECAGRLGDGTPARYRLRS